MKPDEFKKSLEIFHKNYNSDYYKELYKEEFKTGIQDIILISLMGIIIYYFIFL